MNLLVLGGTVFLGGHYEGRPFSLSIVVRALAGPFDMGRPRGSKGFDTSLRRADRVLFPAWQGHAGNGAAAFTTRARADPRRRHRDHSGCR